MSTANNPVPDGQSDLEISAVRENDEGDFTVTLPRRKFAAFLLGFLGPRETLSKSYPNDFVVKLDDIFQFHHLLVQKIKKKNFISLSLAISTLHYEDGTHRTINTIEALEKFHEYRDLGVISFNLVWQFLFREPEEALIQQQKVNVLFNTQDTGTAGAIAISIEHTNQVWAVEVLHLFEEPIKKVSVQYSLPYRILGKLRKFNIFGPLFFAAIIAVFGGAIYIDIQKNNLAAPAKVEAEFLFDLANVLSPMTPAIQGPTTNPPLDPTLLIQFFLIRDLRSQDHGVIEFLQSRGYFDQRYAGVVDKLMSGYYDESIKSNRVTTVPKYEQAQMRIIENISSVVTYMKIVVLYIFGYAVSASYLLLFRRRSVIAITSKGERTLQKQERDKSNAIQLLFGVVASLIATVLYELLGRMAV